MISAESEIGSVAKLMPVIAINKIRINIFFMFNTLPLFHYIPFLKYLNTKIKKDHPNG